MDSFDSILGMYDIPAGKYERVIDKNNRFVVPSELRESLPNNGIVRIMRSPTNSEHKCLYAYSESDWAELCKSIKPQITPDEEGRRKARKFATSFVTGKVDVSSRFTLDKELKEFAGITDKVVIVSTFNHIELWSLENWNAENSAMGDVDISGMAVYY